MFKSGISILVDQDMSFAEAPIPCVVKPENLSVIGKNQLTSSDEVTEKNTLIKSVGTNFMVFEGFIASQCRDALYISPYSNQESHTLLRQVCPFEGESICQYKK